jgi:hypothetical protein
MAPLAGFFDRLAGIGRDADAPPDGSPRCFDDRGFIP